MSLEVDASGAFAVNVPFAYTEGASPDAELVMTQTAFDSGGNIISQVYYLFADDVVAELFPPPGSALLPIIRFYDMNSGPWGWEPTTDYAFDPTQFISMGTELLPVPR